MEPITTITHATRKAQADGIKNDGFFRPSTWFVCSLPDGTVSRNDFYGDQFFDVPLQDVLQQFEDPKLYWRETVENHQNRGKSYYNLHLFESSCTSIPPGFKLLEMANNDYLSLNVDTREYKVMPFKGQCGNIVSICLEKEVKLPQEYTYEDRSCQLNLCW